MPDELSPEIKALAMAAGLSVVLSEFPNDVAVAAASAVAATKALKLPADPLAEPWPPMQVGFVS
jgi:hypothetical protein